MQPKRLSNLQLIIEYPLPWLTLILLLAYTYARFFHIPYVGFDFNPSNGQVLAVYTEPLSDVSLQRDDLLIQVGSVTFEDFRANSRQPLFEEVKIGYVTPLMVRRGDQILTIPWVIPGPNQQEILDRLINVWWLAYVFWSAGTATSLFVRPKDTRWILMTASCFLTAIWLMAGSISSWQVWESTILLRIAIWLCVPVYLHLHWVIPKPLCKIPTSLLWFGYLIAIGFAGAEFFQVPPRSVFFAGFSLAVLGSLVFLVLHFIRQPVHRREVGLLAAAIILAFTPSVGISIARLFTSYPRWGGGVILAIPIIPLMYFYTIYRRQLGGLEFRANPLITLYLFLVLLGTALSVLVPLANTWLDFPDAPTFVGVSVALLSCLLVIIGYPRFERFIDRHLLVMTLPPEHLVEEYSSRITTSLDVSGIIHLLRDEILPSLLIRQSALLSLENDTHVVPLYVVGVDETGIPMEVDASELLAQAGRYRPPSSLVDQARAFHWVRLLFPLEVGGELLGLWLLGRRDPDDHYAQAEISVLQTIANQTAIALVNAAQAARLRALYQANIERHEEERSKLARDLHDEILNQMAALSMSVDHSAVPNFEEHYQVVATRLRQMISGLRPAMLIYGLRAALEELADEMSERIGNDVIISMDLPLSDARYDPRVEAHLFRIVQQACENAVRHAHANTIRIYGDLEPEGAVLIVEDDGVGIVDRERLDFDRLLAEKHFGLAGMYERAAIIGAELHIDSAKECGTQVTVSWHPDRNRGVL